MPLGFQQLLSESVANPAKPTLQRGTGEPSGLGGRLVVGDSIGAGLAKQLGLDPALTKVGRSPKDVLGSLQGQDFAGKDVILSSGASNNPKQLEMVMQQLAAMKGAKGVTVMGVGDRPDFRGVNDQLAQMVQQAKAQGINANFAGPLANLSADRVHPKSYAGLLDKPADTFVNKRNDPGLPKGASPSSYSFTPENRGNLTGGAFASPGQVYTMLLGRGLNHREASSLAGVLAAESRSFGGKLYSGSFGKQGSERGGALNPRGAFGFAQFNGPRQKLLADFAGKRGMNPADPHTQLDFIVAEAKGRGIRLDNIADIVHRYESPREDLRPREIAAAQRIAAGLSREAVPQGSLASSQGGGDAPGRGGDGTPSMPYETGQSQASGGKPVPTIEQMLAELDTEDRGGGGDGGGGGGDGGGGGEEEQPMQPGQEDPPTQIQLAQGVPLPENILLGRAPGSVRKAWGQQVEEQPRRDLFAAFIEDA